MTSIGPRPDWIQTGGVLEVAQAGAASAWPSRTTVADPRPTAQHSGQIVTVVPSKRVRVNPEKSSW